MDNTNSPSGPRRDSAFSNQQQTTAVPWTHSSVAQDVLSVFSTRPLSPPPYNELNSTSPPPPPRGSTFPQTLFHAWILIFKHITQKPHYWILLIVTLVCFYMLDWLLQPRPFIVLYVVQTLFSSSSSSKNTTPENSLAFHNNTSRLSQFLMRVLRKSLYQLQQQGYFNSSLFYVTATPSSE